MRASIKYASVLVLGLGSAGCSGGTEGTPEGAAGAATTETPGDACSANSGPIDPTALIDDLEDANATIVPTGERNGSWWITSDGTTNGSVEPPADQAPPPEKILGGRCGSQFAMRMTGEGFTEWGAALITGFRYTTDVAPIDASAFSGVMFYARVGELHTSSVRVQLQDSNTEPPGGRCNPEVGASDECYNGFGTALIPLDTTWRLYKLPFSSATQREGWGYRADALDTTNLYDLEWLVEPNTIFDLWIDDPWFYE